VNFRLRDFIRYPYKILSFRRFLSHSEHWTSEELQEWCLVKLRNTLNHAFKNVPYYTKLINEYNITFKQLENFDDLKQIPFLNRDLICTRMQDMIANDYLKYDPTKSHTSGSTGTPMHFLLDKYTNILEFASLWRVLNWTGYRFGDKYASLHGRIIKNDKLFEYDWRTNCLHLSSFNFKDENIKIYDQKIKLFKPKIIKAYPSSITLFSQWLKESNIEPYQPKAIVTSSESLLDHHREIIKQVYDCPIHDFYGQNERAALISTCPNGIYHIHQEYSHVEIIDDCNNPVKLGEAGEIVTTSFHNYAMPMIRYRTGDFAIRSKKDCPCGRPYPTIDKIIGRIEDLVVTPDGRYVGRMDASFKYSNGIRFSQIIQKDINEIIVKIVKNEYYRKNDENILHYHLQKRLGDIIAIKFKYVDKIPFEKNGKIKFVKSSVAPKYQINKDHN
jgi:phenylacetate-CoA ligase